VTPAGGTAGIAEVLKLVETQKKKLPVRPADPIKTK